MSHSISHFGIAWLVFTTSFAIHVIDEASHGFLAEYNARVRSMRRRFSWLPIPTFRFQQWLTLLTIGIIALLAVSPFAFAGYRWIRIGGLAISIFAGVLNACLHIAGSLCYRRWLPGVYSSPLLLASSINLSLASVSR